MRHQRAGGARAGWRKTEAEAGGWLSYELVALSANTSLDVIPMHHLHGKQTNQHIRGGPGGAELGGCWWGERGGGDPFTAQARLPAA
jgi:hypothetical protein